MNMILYAVHNNCFTAGFIYQGTNYTLEGWSPAFFDNCFAVFHCKNKMYINLMIRVSHNILHYTVFDAANTSFNSLIISSVCSPNNLA